MSNTRTIVDTRAARIVALVLAIALAAVFYAVWKEEVSTLFGDLTAPEAEGLAVTHEDPAVAACLETRIADVDRMREDGLIDDAQHEVFAERAASLCVAQAAGR